MLTDFLPAIISLAVLVSAFLLGYSSDARKIRRMLAEHQRQQPSRVATAESDSFESPELG
jgi:hypothetical protein